MKKKAKQQPLNDDVRQRIFEVAREVFIDKGYDGARMQNIADKANINKAMLHYYFGNKEGLFQEVFQAAFQKLYPQLKSIIETDLPFFEKIERIIIAQINHFETVPGLPLFINNELAKGNVQLKNIIQAQKKNDFMLAFAEQLEAEIKAKRIRPIKPTQLLINILSLVIFPFLAKPMLSLSLNLDPIEHQQLIEERKVLIPQFIQQALKMSSND